MTTRADGVSVSVSLPSVGVICTVSTPNASPSARPTGAEIGLTSSLAMPSRSSAVLGLLRRVRTQRPQLGILEVDVLAEEQRDDVHFRQRRIGVERVG